MYCQFSSQVLIIWDVSIEDVCKGVPSASAMSTCGLETVPDTAVRRVTMRLGWREALSASVGSSPACLLMGRGYVMATAQTRVEETGEPSAVVTKAFNFTTVSWWRIWFKGRRSIFRIGGARVRKCSKFSASAAKFKNVYIYV